MSNLLVEITDEERKELAGALGGFIYTFFLGKESVPATAGNRRAAEKTSQVIGRAVAAVTHTGKIDGDYLMLSRRFEVAFGEAAIEAADTVIKKWIRPVQTEDGGQ
ncbi:hypothetical protein QAO71_15740 [Halopseudomonas sp. SMJS2]|uniref:hypothetical protein n=1 Tax=Halopseudomonas sp. SMJS2 TaxID=3041098 RepID=UPI002452F5AF|nr:hypothetical protein [Halopseudomonas sp. SMJS2]WGK61477.1 hypothetical protein QAO71_15740 [Halopseudomonas sp. SMJS2]